MTSDEDYEYSEELNKELLANNNIKPENVLTLEDLDKNSVKTEEILQIVVYFRNFDSNGNIVNINECVETKIDIFERLILKSSWIDTKYTTDDEGNISYTSTPIENYKVSEDHTILLDDDLLKDKDSYYICNDRMMLKVFLKEYFENNLNNKNKKSLVLKYHSPTNRYEFYNLDDEFIDYLSSIGYNGLDFNLENKKLEIKNTKTFIFKTFRLTDVELDNYESIEFDVDSLYFNNLIVNNFSKNKKDAIGISFKDECDLKYVEIKNRIIPFIIKNANKDIHKWIESSLSIYNFNYMNYVDDSKFDVTESFIKISNINTVYLSGVNVALKNINLPILNMNNINELSLSNIKVYSYEAVNKNIIILSGCKECRISDITMSIIDFINKKEVYLFAVSNGDVFTKYSFSAINIENIGFISIKNDNSDNLSVCGLSGTFKQPPIRFKNSIIRKIVFTNVSIESVYDFEISGRIINIFNSNLYLKKNSNINVYERLLISQSNINCDKDTVFDINLAESPTVIFDNSYIRTKTLNIIGDSGNGKVNFKTTNITCKFVKVTDIEKISCDNSAFRSKELELKALNIIGFKPSMKGEMLKKIKILGRIQNSIILIDNLSPTKCEYDFDTCNGKITILYNDAIGNDVIQLSDCKLEIYLETTSDIKEKRDIKLINKSSSKKSKIMSKNIYLNLVPVAEYEFSEFAKFKDDNDDYNEKVVYGVL